YVADPQDLSIRAFRDDVLAGLGSDALVDVRSVDEYTGRLAAPAGLPQEGGRQRGHIPGAVSIPWNRAVTRDGTFRTDADLREIYADFLDEPGRRVVTYCRIGERSSHTWFVLHELLDQPDVVNYDGSWVEYGSLIGVPVER
ncbi:MAG: rhodanese-like domain-containing protein, partial [Dietzia sp.]